MKILIQSDEYLPRHVPIAIRMHVFYRVFSEKGNQIKILTGSHSLDGGTTKALDTIYCPTVPLKKKTSINRMINQISFSLSSLINSVRAGSTDVIITSTPPILIGISAWIMAKLKRAVLIYDVRDIWPDVAIEIGSFSEKSIYCRLFRRISDFMYLHADIITTVSSGKQKKLQEKLPVHQRGKVWLVENGLDESFINQSEDETVIQKYKLNQKRTIVYFGNIGLAQGLKHLINLATKIDSNEYQILLFGDGVERKNLEQTVEDRKLDNVFFCGRVHENTIFTVLRHAFAAYIPLVNANLKDSVPTKTYEALGVGCPVILVAEGDATELIKETGFGISLSPDQISQLPEVFRQFCKAYPQMIERREAAQASIINKHSRQKISEEFECRMKAYIGGKEDGKRNRIGIYRATNSIDAGIAWHRSGRNRL